MIDIKALKEFANIDPAGLAELLLEESPEVITEIFYATRGEDADPDKLKMFLAGAEQYKKMKSNILKTLNH